MFIPNETVYNLLSAIEGVEVFQNRPETITVFPCLTYYISSNVPEIDLSKEISFQNIEVVVDIWSKTSSESADLLDVLESTMRANGFVLSFSSEVADPYGISHIATRFKFIY